MGETAMQEREADTAEAPVEAAEQVASASEQTAAAQAAAAKPAELPVNASIRAYDDKAKMQMAFFVDPPEFGGADITIEQLRENLKNNKVVYGIQEEELERIVRDRVYGKQTTVAVGKPVVDGVDGKIIERFPREFKPTFQERGDGTIDFKEMNLVVNVSEGDVICEIVKPIDGEQGTNIYGVVIKPRRGLAPIPPKGENTVVNEEGTALVATVDGSLIFKKDKFCVDRVFTVPDNVDNSTGNISFNGDVVVKGTVQEGFSVQSKGHVRVCGIVEGASIVAGGSITLEKGINGMGHGTLTAGGDITSKYIENCSICAGGNVIAESIINCTVESDGDVTVSGQQGRIVGGKLTVFGSVKAVNIGSRSAVSTTITLGVTPRLLKEKNEMDEQLKELHQQNEEMAKNLMYLERADRIGQVNTDERRAALNNLRLKTPMMAMREARLKQQKDQMEAELQKVKECTLSCQTLFPPARISIGNAISVLQDMHQNCRIYRNSAGEITVGIL